MNAVDSTNPKFMSWAAIFRGFWRPENMVPLFREYAGVL
jgi:hypothetical protein